MKTLGTCRPFCPPKSEAARLCCAARGYMCRAARRLPHRRPAVPLREGKGGRGRWKGESGERLTKKKRTCRPPPRLLLLHAAAALQAAVHMHRARAPAPLAIAAAGHAGAAGEKFQWNLAGICQLATPAAHSHRQQPEEDGAEAADAAAERRRARRDRRAARSRVCKMWVAGGAAGDSGERGKGMRGGGRRSER